LTDLEAAVEEAFVQHDDAPILLSFPGLGTRLGARILADIGDDRNRLTDARALRAFAGLAPVTRTSGPGRYVQARRAKNDRIVAARYDWAMAAIRHDPDWEAKYRARRAAGDRHVTALRKLFNSLPKLHPCLTTGQSYRPDLAFGAARTTAA
jgi:transposase